MKRLNHNLLQSLIYAIIWLVVFVVPVFVHSHTGKESWDHLAMFWIRILPFFVLFLVNNYLLVPRLLLRKRWAWYAVSVVASIFVLFSVVQPFVIRNKFDPMIAREMAEIRDRAGRDSTLTRHDFPRHREHGPMGGPSRDMPREGRDSLGMAHGRGMEGRDQGPRFRDMPPGEGPVIRMPVRMSMMLNDWLVAILIVGFNIAIQYLFKSIRDDRRISELQASTLQSELNYLKAQINPHFFMNTLNNIHALIDIDGERAKESVIELSKIMRYVLYEADQQGIQLSREIQFIENYVSLMRIRFSDEIDIRMEFPDPVPDVRVPPMLLVTLVENAFKHGISYRRDSFIHTSLTVEEGLLTYTVSNSLSETVGGKPGVGMENMRKRLNLLFGGNYTFESKRTLEKYSVTLILPVE